MSKIFLDNNAQTIESIVNLKISWTGETLRPIIRYFSAKKWRIQTSFFFTKYVHKRSISSLMNLYKKKKTFKIFHYFHNQSFVLLMTSSLCYYCMNCHVTNCNYLTCQIN